MTSLERYSRKYRTPEGAVTDGASVRFSFPSLSCGRLFLLLREDGGSTERFELDRTGEGFSLTRVFGRPGLYFYAFTDGEGRFLRYRGEKPVFSEDEEWAQQTVYSSSYEPASSYYGGIAYQIFPDRFAIGGGVRHLKGRKYHTDLREQPKWREKDGSGLVCDDFYGGNLRGIRESIPYLKELGVDLLYLNPIFSSPSNHRYNTSDYLTVDPQLGTEQDLRDLCAEARANGIRILLDGVFSHTGDDSVYFNRYGTYGDGGAYRDKNSPYYDWYKFRQWPDDYVSWWGFRTLPEVMEETPSYVEFITGENGVIHHWMQTGVSGFRLDVADELPDSFIEKVREAVRREDPEGLLIGEVWEDASNKVAYGERRKYFQGRELDGVMGYTFRDAVLDFVRDGDAGLFRDRVTRTVLHYPEPMLNCCLNLLGSHDTPRAINMLACPDVFFGPMEGQAAKHLTRDEYLRGVEMLRLSYALLFFLPGIPMIYYGDEGGMQGYKDPLCRGFYVREDADRNLLDQVKKLSALRKEHAATLKSGRTEFFLAEDGAVGFLRGEEERIAFLLNRGSRRVECPLPGGGTISAGPWSYAVKKI